MAPDLVTLSWCLGEIREALKQADRLLSRQLETGDDDYSSLRAARASVHQAHGALQVVAIDGVALLTQEAEQVLDSIERGELRLSGELVARLERAFQAIVEHCDELLHDVPHQPLYLYPYYRMLLEARGAERIHPADLFFPDLAVRLPDPEGGYLEIDPEGLVRARSAFERGLLQLMREPGSSAGAQSMREAVHAICDTRIAASNRAFWWVTQAYFEALASGRVDVDVAVKRLLARFNLQLRKTLGEGAPVAERLVKDMLFGLATLKEPTQMAAAVRDAFRLDGTIPEDYEQQRYGRLDERVLRSGRDALARARSAFDKVTRGSIGELASFSQALDGFCDAADQLPADGLRALGRAFAHTRQALGARVDPPSDALALEIAAAILFAEQALEQGARAGSEYDRHGYPMAARLEAALGSGSDVGDDTPEWLLKLSQSAQERMTMTAFVAETIGNMRGVEKLLDAYFRDPTQRGSLPECVRALHQVAGALRLLGHDDAGTGADNVATRVAAFADDEDSPDTAGCERVAASVGALGFFIEALQHPERASGHFELDALTGDFRAHLGRAPEAPEVRELDEFSAPGESQHSGSVFESIEPSAESALAEQLERAAVHFAALSAQPEDDAIRAQLRETMARVRDASALLDDSVRKTAAADSIELLAESQRPLALEVLASALAAAGVALPKAQVGTAEMPGDDAAIDSELLDIFLTEATEVLGAIAEHVGLSRAHPGDQQYLTTLRRGFHTLKGSSRMVGLHEFGEAAWAMEQALNQWLADERPGTEALYQLIDEAHARIGAWVALLVGSLSAAAAIDPRPLIAAADALREGGSLAPLQVTPVDEFAQSDAARDSDDDSVESLEIATSQAQSPEPAAASADDVDVDFESERDSVVGAGHGDDAGEPDPTHGYGETIVIGGQPISRALYQIFLSEADELIGALIADVKQWIGDPQRGATDEAIRIAHSLSGSASVVLLDPVHEIAGSLEAFMHAQRECGQVPLREELEVCEHAIDRIQAMLHQFAAGNAPRDESFAMESVAVLAGDWVARLHAAPVEATGADETDAFDAQTTDGALDENDVVSEGDVAGEGDALSANDVSVETEIAGADDVVAEDEAPEAGVAPVSDEVRDDVEALELLEEIGAVDEPGDIEPDGEVISTAEIASDPEIESTIEIESGDAPAVLEGIDESEVLDALDELEQLDQLDALDSTKPEPPRFDSVDGVMDELLADIPSFDDDAAETAATAEQSEDWVDTQPARFDAADRVADLQAVADFHSLSELAPDADFHSGDDLVESVDAIPLPADELDADLLPVFIEEALDYLPQIGDNLRRWLAEPGDPSLPQTLMRQLHTVKGGSRMAGAMGLGQLLHEIETRVESLAGLASVPASLIEELISYNDRVAAMFEAIRNPELAASADPAHSQPPVSTDGADSDAMDDADSAIASLSAIDEAPSGAPYEASKLPDSGSSQSDSGAGSPAHAPFDSPPANAVPAAPATAAAPRTHALVRVRADLLDKLVNEAGEVSIARSRLDNQLTGMRQSLGELSENVNRLRSQLREIEIQAESQIQARIALQKEHELAFDPLEFDRYTRFQELTRMLAESVNDVSTVQHNAARGLDEASQDLHRQGQVLRDLQQNLMRVRMVQFGTISDRLYRVVRQAGKELDKRVHLDIRGSAVELDRSVLEKMAGPIEHLLRNAVAHGIESRERRLERGKSETGEIAVEVRQEGREIVLSFNDDGSGLDFERIRSRGIAAGLITADSTPGERELADLIFMPGFTTATSVTEIAGRGVGMDVVRAEVATLGGRVETESTAGEGTRFTVHLPLTLAVAQIVLVRAGSARFAVSSSSVEQVLQLKPQGLASAYADGGIDWQGARVPLFYLGSLVELPNPMPVAQHYSPVVIMRAGHARIALHCDEITRNQEVVVKGVGSQVARVRGVAGATVLGNGEIVLIINPVAFAQSATGEILDRAVQAPPIAAMSVAALPAIVMVVDDSLTVRKVTQRLLAREGYQVLLAKDGVDALRQMQDTVPDVMLVDIEMPRMDGFDLTRNIRADERYARIPIVMITSRTADKHRNFAMSLGVDVFLGKPYPEDELLAHVATFSANRRNAAIV